MKRFLFILTIVALTSCATQKRAPKVSREQTLKIHTSGCHVTAKSERKYRRHLHKMCEL